MSQSLLEFILKVIINLFSVSKIYSVIKYFSLFVACWLPILISWYLTYIFFCGAHPASCTLGNGGSFPGGKLPGREADHSPPSNADVKNAWRYTSTSEYVFMAWCLIKHRDNFALLYLTGYSFDCLWRFVGKLWGYQKLWPQDSSWGPSKAVPVLSTSGLL